MTNSVSVQTPNNIILLYAGSKKNLTTKRAEEDRVDGVSQICREALKQFIPQAIGPDRRIEIKDVFLENFFDQDFRLSEEGKVLVIGGGNAAEMTESFTAFEEDIYLFKNRPKTPPIDDEVAFLTWTRKTKPEEEAKISKNFRPQYVVKNKVRQFVTKQGGGYLGICAGGILASTDYADATPEPTIKRNPTFFELEAKRDVEQKLFQLLNGINTRGPIDLRKILDPNSPRMQYDLKSAGKSRLSTDRSGNTGFTYWNSGPYFSPKEPLSETFFSTYSTPKEVQLTSTTPSLYSSLCTTAGNGHVAVAGIHPEIGGGIKGISDEPEFENELNNALEFRKNLCKSLLDYTLGSQV